MIMKHDKHLYGGYGEMPDHCTTVVSTNGWTEISCSTIVRTQQKETTDIDFELWSTRGPYYLRVRYAYRIKCLCWPAHNKFVRRRTQVQS